MTLTIEVAFVLLCVIGILLWMLWREKQWSRKQQEHYFWMAAAADLYIFDYDARHDDMRLSESCAYLLQLPEYIKNFSAAAKSAKDSLQQDSMDKLQQAMQTNQRGKDLAITRPNGQREFYRISSHRFCDYGDYRLNRVMGIFADVTNDVIKENRLAQKAKIDPLTGIYNRRAIAQLVESDFNDILADGSQGAFLMLDVDHFKNINDTSGHQAGDAILCGLTALLQKHSREGDYIGRMGGDEFCIFLKDMPSHEAVARYCERIIQEVPQKLHFGEEQTPATISIGGTLTKDYDSFQLLYGRADKALYEAKQGGRNQFVLA